MASTISRRHRWTRIRSSAAHALLAVAVLIPATVLFVQSWRASSARIGYAAQERRGVDYLLSLQPLITALTDAQSAAVAGQQVDRDALSRAEATAAGADQQLGGALRTHERWSTLRTKIDALAGGQLAGAAAYDGYSDVTGLLLALYDKVREESGLIRDPDADAYYLEDGAAQELPEGVVAAGQYGDLIAVALTHPAAQQTSDTTAIIAAREALASNASDLANDVQLAVDRTASRTLSSDLLSRLDRFRRSIDAMAPSTSLRDGRATQADAVEVASGRKEVQAAASELSGALLRAIDNLLQARIDGVNGSRRIAVGALLAVILLAVGSVLITVLRWRRAGTGGTGTAVPAPPAIGYPGSGGTDEQRPVLPVGVGTPAGGWDPPVRTAASEEAIWRERFGAAR